MNEDCGYYMACSDGLIWYPPAGSADREPVLIPWDSLLDNAWMTTDNDGQGERL